MSDRLSPAERSRHMARIRAADTAPEIHLRKGLHRAGFRFRLHSRSLPGRPDIVLPRFRAAIFVHGCFWHRHLGCSMAYIPKSRVDFWSRKFSENVERDWRHLKALLDQDWRVAVVWECGLRRARSRPLTIHSAVIWLRSGRAMVEIPKASAMRAETRRADRRRGTERKR
jgi:DNA mismatch endonuclease, patch repair protein